MEYVLEWHVNARTEKKFRDLLAASRFCGEPMKIQKDDAALFLVIGRS